MFEKLKKLRWQLVTWITIIATRFSNILVRKREQSYQFEEYAQMQEGSLGRTFYNYLKTEKISYKANLIRHDLKHILLDYKMNMPDELRIHAFLLGNRCYNPMSMAYLALCVVLVPETISKLKHDYNRGKQTKSLKGVNLQKYVQFDLNICRNLLKIPPQIQSLKIN